MKKRFIYGTMSYMKREVKQKPVPAAPKKKIKEAARVADSARPAAKKVKTVVAAAPAAPAVGKETVKKNAGRVPAAAASKTPVKASAKTSIKVSNKSAAREKSPAARPAVDLKTAAPRKKASRLAAAAPVVKAPAKSPARQTAKNAKTSQTEKPAARQPLRPEPKSAVAKTVSKTSAKSPKTSKVKAKSVKAPPEKPAPRKAKTETPVRAPRPKAAASASRAGGRPVKPESVAKSGGKTTKPPVIAATAKNAPATAKTHKAASTRQIDAAPPIERPAEKRAEKPIKKKIKPISSAVLRGKSGRYDFEVFPLDAEFEKAPAIYVISKRVTDKQRRGHHKLICIGESSSLFEDIKKHRKNKCLKEHQANAVCLLKEQDAASRLRIASDLREAHAIVCRHE